MVTPMRLKEGSGKRSATVTSLDMTGRALAKDKGALSYSRTAVAFKELIPSSVTELPHVSMWFKMTSGLEALVLMMLCTRDMMLADMDSVMDSRLILGNVCNRLDNLKIVDDVVV